ncbi:MAG: hypothetical protein LBJ08_09690 [Bifidobacteriaceae bacterium]|nr:hypothetical protein [Bifidobacteriaceae bacterium]
MGIRNHLDHKRCVIPMGGPGRASLAGLAALALVVATGAGPASADDPVPVTQVIRVLDRDGAPVAGLRVALCPELGSTANWICAEQDLYWETTDPEGAATYAFSSWRVEDRGQARIAGFDPTALPGPARLISTNGTPRARPSGLTPTATGIGYHRIRPWSPYGSESP